MRAVKRIDPDPGANMGDFLRLRAAQAPERVAVIVEATGERISYGELNARTNRLAAALLGLGARRGDRVALALGSVPVYLALYNACAKIGAILVPLNTRLAAPEIAFQIRDCEPRVIVRRREIPVPEEYVERALTPEALLEEAPSGAPEPHLAPGGEAPQILMYTSGTTGVPKGALLPHRKTLYNSLNAERFFGLGEGDVVVAPVPLFHSFGLLILSVPALFCGATLVLVERFDPEEIQHCVGEHRGTILGGVPIMFQRMLRAGLDREALAPLRYAFSAGAALDVETIRAFWDAGIPIQQAYGQTETSILCCLEAADALRKAGSVGRPVAWGRIRIVDEEGKDLSPGKPGEIVVAGPIVMLGYGGRPEETRAGRIGGWHRTGDLAVRDDEGFVTLVGRLKDMYVSGGENVYPAEVERVLEEHPAVSEAAVVGVPDNEWGETGCAYVVPADPAFDADAILAWARERLAAYKLPRRMVTVDSLPRTPSGKVRKQDLGESDAG
jgi:fatty-acyl-CoA synthase